MHIKTVNGWRPLIAPCVNSNQLEGVYAPESRASASADNEIRAEFYANDVRLYIAGGLRKEQIFRSFNVPRRGAYGEKL